MPLDTRPLVMSGDGKKNQQITVEFEMKQM